MAFPNSAESNYLSSSPLRSDRAVAAWLLACAAMVFLIVLIGGITRLTESGLSITEWKPVSGVVPPIGDAQWTAEFEKYQRTPEYQELKRGMSLAEFKVIFFWEYLHRLWGRLVGIVFALPFAYLLARGRIPKLLRARLTGILLLIGMQGALGWYMVESGLSERTDVSQYRLAAHMSLAIFIYILLFWTGLSMLGSGTSSSIATRLRGVRARSLAVVALILVTITSGAFVAGLNAGRAFNTFPLMAGRVVPEGYWGMHPWYLNFFENVAAVQFNHRLLAILTLVFSLYAIWSAGREQLPSLARTGVRALAAAVVLQVALGILTLLSGVSIALAVAHQAGAVVVLTASLLTLRGVTSRSTYGALATVRTAKRRGSSYISLRTEGE